MKYFTYYYQVYDITFKNPSFSVKIIYKKKKALQQMPKGCKLSAPPTKRFSNFLHE